MRTAALSRRPRSGRAVAAMATVAALATFLCGGPPALATPGLSPASYAFTILGPSGVVARVITPESACPSLTVDGATLAMKERAAPDMDFLVRVCDVVIPTGAKAVSLGGQPLALPPGRPEHVVVLGDTGCRLKGSAIQACNDPAQWPFAAIARQVAATHPDLVIHVGDYHYRETACDTSKADCGGSPFGDNWPAWEADFFAPAGPLLAAAPWVFVVGNHEDCSRAGMGFFRLLDPRPMPATCPPYSDPYALDYVDPQLIVLDDSAVNDFQVEPEQLAVYTKQFQQIAQMARGNTWLLMHDPMYVFGHLDEKDGQEQLFIDQLTLQQASNNSFPPSLQLFVGGHVHLFETLSFTGGRPPQLTVGNSGTLLDPPITTPLTGQVIAGQPVADGSTVNAFGFVVMTRAADGWQLALKGVDGAELTRCTLSGLALHCGAAAVAPARLPGTGFGPPADPGLPRVALLAAAAMLAMLGQALFVVVRRTLRQPMV